MTVLKVAFIIAGQDAIHTMSNMIRENDEMKAVKRLSCCWISF